MSLIFATQLTAVATAALAVFAVFTAWYARRAFREQSREVCVLKSQLKDQQQLTGKQTPVLELQGEELQASLVERKREAAERRRAQATRVFIWQEYREGNPALSQGPPPPIWRISGTPAAGSHCQ